MPGLAAHRRRLTDPIAGVSCNEQRLGAFFRRHIDAGVEWTDQASPRRSVSRASRDARRRGRAERDSRGVQLPVELHVERAAAARENAVQATVRKMSDTEAGGVAMRIVNMLGIIARNQSAARPKLRAVGED